MAIKSIKNKILFYYSLILFLVIVVFSVSLYQTIKYNIESDLIKNIHFIEDEINYFIEDDIDGLIKNIENKNKNFVYEADPDLISYDSKNGEYKLDTTSEADIRGFYIEIKDLQTGKSIIRSLNMKESRFDKFNFVLDNKERELIIDFISKDNKSIYKAEMIDKKYSVHIAKSLKDINEQLTDMLKISIVFSILLFIITFILSSYLIKKTIMPMKEILSSAKDLKAHDLSKRLDVPASNDEFEELGNTFNDMFDEIESSFEKLKKFNSDASHELKTPLTIISGEIELLLKKDRSTKEYKEALTSIFEETQNLKNIVNTLLMLTNINKGDFTNKFKKFDINDILLKVYEEYFFIAQKQNIILDIKNLDVCSLKCDDVLIRSLFSNLIDNAIKFSNEHTKVIIDLVENEKNIVFKVIDEGIGLSKMQKKNIFDRFYRADESHNKRIKGFGLGLAIVKNIAEIHNIQINVSDNRPQGSIFEIKFIK